ncbi:unnamed protein product [Merluccius merluccius]
MSLDDLLGGVDRSLFYRYNGSLTTPTCNEAVVWTIFSQPIRMDKKLVSVSRLSLLGPRVPESQSPTVPEVQWSPAPEQQRVLVAAPQQPLEQSHRPSGDITGLPNVLQSSSAHTVDLQSGPALIVSLLSSPARRVVPRAVLQSNSAYGTTWCYHDASCGPAAWPTVVSPEFCNGSRQSPVNIDTGSATEDSSLNNFNFNNYNSTSGLTTITNTGRTVKVALQDLTVSGGGLSTTYNSLQFHLHWGNGYAVPGSEHTVNGMRYPMEMHIVNMKQSFNGNVTLALADSEGLAALGFFIEVMDGDATASPASWNTLASYLANITNSGDSANINSQISMDDLLDGVDRSRYYRYLGSLTTPTCNEVVIWTVFKDPIKVSKDVINRFNSTVHIGNDTSILMINTYRNIQPNQEVKTTVDNSGSSITLASAQMAIAAIWAFTGF